MNPTKVNAIQSLCPDAEFILRGDDLEWLDKIHTQPTETEIQAELDRLIAEQPRKDVQAARSAAYRNEADPLFFKAQRGEATIEEWQLKVAEIRSLYPYPNEEPAQ
jgi:hypothetical protein